MPGANEPPLSHHLVAPELREALEQFPNVDFSQGLEPYRVEFVAEMMPPLPPELEVVRREERFIPGPSGAPDVRILIYVPPDMPAGKRPALLNIHGGGYVIGAPEQNDAANRARALILGCPIVATSYRLAPKTAFPGAVEKLESLVETARDAGVEHLVLLSGRGEHHARRGEDVVRNSGVDFTIVRSAWFAQNFSEGYLRDPILAGALPMPGGDVAEPIIDVDDIADVVVAALTEGGHRGELYEVTDPRLMTFAAMAADLSSAIGRPVRHVPITFEEFHDGIAQAGGEFVADVFTAIARETLDGRNASLGDGVSRALCRPPRDFTEFARNAAKADAWQVAA